MFIVFGFWEMTTRAWLVFRLPDRKSKVLRQKRDYLKKLKAQIDQARSASAPVGPAIAPKVSTRRRMPLH
jgi:hypothetical protein